MPDCCKPFAREAERLRGERDDLRAENERLRAALRDHDSCVVCEAALVPYDGPLHCEDCIVEDEHYYAWQDRRSALSESEGHMTLDEWISGRAHWFVHVHGGRQNAVKRGGAIVALRALLREAAERGVAAGHNPAARLMAGQPARGT